MFLSKIGNDILWLGTIIIGGIVTFLTFRSKYISKGEDRAIRKANENTLRRIIQAKKAEENFDYVRGEKVDITGNGYPDDFVWGFQAVTGK